MKPEFTVNKETNVAFLDVAETPANARVEVVEVSELLGLKSHVVARIDRENEIVFGLIIEDYKAFRWEIRRKYFALRIEGIAELLVCAIKSVVTQQSRDHERQLLHA